MKKRKGSSSREGSAARHRPHLGVLLERARRRLYDQVARDAHQAGFTELRPAHAAVFAFLPADGTRLTELARRAQVTKQSMGELVRDLERSGYLVQLPDPADGRAKIVTFTDRGRVANEVGILAVSSVEDEWAERIGADRARELRATLEALTELRD
jgi:DNA-binding MarR family transcriptional regulator